jgi:large conductance mechanosensitive channel
MSVLSEFREFIARGNVIDLAVGVIIGASFGAITTSLVEQVIMPPIGLLTGGVDFARLQWVLKPDDPTTELNELVAIQYGAFVNTVIQFLIVAWVVFLLVKVVNSLRRAQAAAPEPAAPPAPTPTEAVLMEIRDILKAHGPGGGPKD